MSLLFAFLWPVCRGVLLIPSRNVFTKWNHLAAMSKQKQSLPTFQKFRLMKICIEQKYFLFQLVKNSENVSLLLIFLHNKLELTGLKSVFFGLANMPLREFVRKTLQRFQFFIFSFFHFFIFSFFHFFSPQKSFFIPWAQKSLALKGVLYGEPIIFLSF